MLSTATPGITVSLHHSDSVSLLQSIPVTTTILVWYYPGCCLPCQCSAAVAHARLLGAHCRHSHAVIPR